MTTYLREFRLAQIDAQQSNVELVDGFTFTVPLRFYPTLLLATEEERGQMEVLPYSLHWEMLDCDLGIERLLQGFKEHPKLAEKAWCRFQARESAPV